MHNAKKGLRTYTDRLEPDRHAPHAQSNLIISLSADKSVKPFSYRLEDNIALRSDCDDVQADLELQCPHLSEFFFSAGCISYVVIR